MSLDRLTRTQPPRLNRRLLAVVVLVIVGAVAWWGLAPSGNKGTAKPETRPQPVVIKPVQSKPMPVVITAVGTVQSQSVVLVRPRVEGEVMKVHFTEGRDVTQGDLLFTLDLRPAEAVRRQAEAQLARDKAQLERARADLRRYTELLKSGNVPVQKVEQTTADVAVLEAAIKADLAAIETSRLTMEYSQIRAPISGRTGVINAKQGNLAKPGDAQSMVTITQIMPINVAFSVPERHLSRIRAGQKTGPLAATVTSTSDPSLKEAGRVTFMDSAIDATTGTIGLKAAFDNAEMKLWPGQFVNVALTLGTEAEALTVPVEAVQAGQQGTFVFVVTPDGTAEIRPITVDRTLAGEAVITKGLAAGEKVVTDGQMRLGQGTKVVEAGAKAP
jgi:multidrug efflux system membrane fusion protein